MRESPLSASTDFHRVEAGIATAPMPGLPADFASRALARIEVLTEHAAHERNRLMSMGIVIFAAMLYFIAPVTTNMLSRSQACSTRRG